MHALKNQSKCINHLLGGGGGGGGGKFTKIGKEKKMRLHNTHDNVYYSVHIVTLTLSGWMGMARYVRLINK